MKVESGDIVTAYTTTQHLLIDLDHASPYAASGLALQLCRDFPYLGNCLVVHNGGKSCHLIFDNIVPFEKLTHIIKLLWDFKIVNDEVVYFREQRGDFSLRVSEKLTVDADRPIPQPIFWIANNMTDCHDSKILDYLHLLSFFNPTVCELIAKPLPLFPILHLASPDLVVYSLRESSGL